MSNKDEKAFPYSFVSEDGFVYAQDGMALRDYFAAAALQGLTGHSDARWHDLEDEPERAAKLAYILADKMMEARDE